MQEKCRIPETEGYLSIVMMGYHLSIVTIAVPLKNNSGTNILKKTTVIENRSAHRVSISCPSNGTNHDVLLHKAI